MSQEENCSCIYFCVHAYEEKEVEVKALYNNETSMLCTQQQHAYAKPL